MSYFDIEEEPDSPNGEVWEWCESCQMWSDSTQDWGTCQCN